MADFKSGRIFTKGLPILVLFLLFPLSSFSAQNNFQVSPPPIPRPDFTQGKVEAKFTGSYIKLDMGTTGSFSGMGVQAAGRKTFDEKQAIDGGMGLLYLSGELAYTGTSKIKGSILMTPYQVDYEYLLLKKDRYTLIGFAGGDITLMTASFDIPCAAGSTACSLSIFSYQYGIPFGLQGGIDVSEYNLKVAPFLSIKRNLGGSSYADVGGMTTPTDIESFTQVTFGSDFILTKYDLSIGSLLQQAGGSGGNDDVKTFMLQFSWLKDFE